MELVEQRPFDPFKQALERFAFAFGIMQALARGPERAVKGWVGNRARRALVIAAQKVGM